MTLARQKKFIDRSLKFWTLFIGIGAVWGALMMWISPSGKMWGMEPILQFLQVLPFKEILFRNFIFSGFVLLCVNGVTQFFAAWLLFRKDRHACLAALLCGIILIMWITLEWVLWGFAWLSNIYFIFGVCETAIAGWGVFLGKGAAPQTNSSGAAEK